MHLASIGNYSPSESFPMKPSFRKAHLTKTLLYGSAATWRTTAGVEQFPDVSGHLLAGGWSAVLWTGASYDLCEARATSRDPQEASKDRVVF